MSDSNAWRRRARCRGLNGQYIDFFYSDETREEAKEFCSKCPVQKQCLDFAIREVDAGHSPKIVSGLGVWGGLDGAERAELRKG